MSNTKVQYLTSNPNCPGGIASVYRSLKEELENAKIENFYTYECGQNKIGYLYKYLKFLLKVNEFEVIHLNTPLSLNSFFRDLPYVIITKCFRRKLILQFHGGEAEFLQKIKEIKPLKILASYSYFSSDKIILLGSNFLNEYSGIRNNRDNKYIILPNPVEKAFLLQEAKCIKPSQKKINIMYLARIDHKKGCEIAIKAFQYAQQIIGKEYELKFNISGDGPLLSEMKDLVRDFTIKNVRFHGYVKGEAKIEQYQNNDIFLYPTYYGEGLPVCILEAMAFGLPVITRNEGGIKDWVENNFNGFVTNSLNPTDFGDVLVDIIRSPTKYNQISRNNIKKANAHFSPKSIVSNYVNLYKSIGRA